MQAQKDLARDHGGPMKKRDEEGVPEERRGHPQA